MTLYFPEYLISPTDAIEYALSALLINLRVVSLTDGLDIVRDAEGHIIFCKLFFGVYACFFIFGSLRKLAG